VERGGQGEVAGDAVVFVAGVYEEFLKRVRVSRVWVADTRGDR